MAERTTRFFASGMLVLWTGLSGLAMAEVPASRSASQPATRPAASVESVYPGLAAGALTFAVPGDLPAGVLLESGEIRLTDKDLAGELGKAPAELRPQLDRSGFFLLEQMATQRLLLIAARRQPGNTSLNDEEAIQEHLQKTVAVEEPTELEIRDFYEQNKEAFGGTPFMAVRDSLVSYVRGQKQQEAVREHIRTIGQHVAIRVSAGWTAKQAQLAKDNPIDKARASGKPSIVDFGAIGCRACDMMTPILKDLESKYKGKANVLFVHVKEEQVLAARYGVQGIPTQVFFDKDGREVFRHTGFYPQADIEKRLAQAGVQ